MNKLTDLELCKRIAEIDGLTAKESDCIHSLLIGKGSQEGRSLHCDLMIKYGVRVKFNDFDACVGLATIQELDIVSEFTCSKEIPRATIECIVEANK